MKKILSGIVFISCISSVFCTDDEKYSFISKIFTEENIGKEIIYHTDRKLSFTIPSIGYVKYVSSFNESIKYVGKKGKFHIIESTLTEMKTENFVANVEIMDYYWQAMEGIPCRLYIERYGTVDHIETIKEEHDYLLEAFEGAYNGMFEKNYIYPLYTRVEAMGLKPLGKKIGESWTGDTDSSKFYFTMNSPPSFAWIEETNKLKKVKDRRGKKIATIEENATLLLDVNIMINILGEDRFIKGRVVGTVDGKWRWDVEAGYAINVRQIINLQGDFEMDDETFFTKLSREETFKLLK